MQRCRWLAIVLAAMSLTITAACGARLSPSLHSAAASADLHGHGGSGPGLLEQTGAPSVGSSTIPQGGSQPSTGVTSEPGALPTSSSGSPITTPTTNSVGSHPTGSHTSNPKTSTSATTSSSSSPTCPTSVHDVGLTSTMINLGAVVDLTGPVNGLFEGAAQGVEAFANYVNSTGGFCGHDLHWDIADGGTNCSQTQDDTTSLIAKDFALVGSFALYDDCIADELKDHPTVADLHTGLNPSAIALPNHFDIAAGTAGGLTGPFAYWAKEFPTQIKHVGTILEDVPSAVAEQNNFEHAAESVGWKFVYSDNASPTASNWTSQFQTMCQKDGVKLVYIETEPVQSAATMMENENEAGCQGVVNIIPIAYDAGFLPDYSGSVSQLKVYGYQEFPLYFNPPGNDAELALFQQWFSRTFPGKSSSFYALYGWVYGRMFEQAYLNAGPTVTRTSFIAALRRIRNFTANDMMPRSDPSTKTSGTHCYLLWQLSDGKFSTTSADPTSGYRCDGKFLANH